MRTLPTLLLSLLLGAGALTSPAYAAPAQADMVKMLQVIDDRQQNSGDYKSTAYIERKEKDKSDLVYQAQIYRRDDSDKLVILFIAPKEEAGKGYLRVDKSLFFYDPTVGKWERRTEREKIGGTDSNRADFDESRLAVEYVPAYVGAETLGKFQVHHLKLTATAEADVAFPVVELWLDQATGNIMKRQDVALSGRLMRTTYYPSWMKLYSDSKKADVYYPKEIRIYDEVEKDNTTTIVIQSVDLHTLEDSIFTKAWLESKSR